MGDRGNIVVRSEYGDVWFYTHWRGSEMKDVLQEVLSRRVRWDDAAYLARMIFSALIKNNVDGETGYGISNCMLDNQHGILVVDVPNQKILRMEELSLVEQPPQLPTVLDYRVSRTFEEFALNGFRGKKKQVERRTKENRRLLSYSLVSGQSRDRFSYGRRKDDYHM